MAGVLLLVMWRGLLPGLLCVCLGFLLTRALTRWFGALAARANPEQAAALGLDATSRVLVFGSEGATDPALYEQIVGLKPQDVGRA